MVLSLLLVQRQVFALLHWSSRGSHQLGTLNSSSAFPFSLQRVPSRPFKFNPLDYFPFSSKGAACKGHWFQPFSTSWTRVSCVAYLRLLHSFSRQRVLLGPSKRKQRCCYYLFFFYTFSTPFCELSKV